jgi:hypothetical protein
MNWSEIYKPVKFTDLVYTDDIHIDCLKAFKNLTNTSLVIINGPVGVGKSTLVRVLAKICNYEILEYTDTITRRNTSLSNKSTILLIEDVENTFSISKILKLGYPVILTSENYFYKDSVTFKIKKHTYESVKSIVERMYKNTGKMFKEYTKIIPWCDFDIRYVLNNLQIQNLNFVRKDHASFYEIFSKHMKWDDFDKNILKFVYNSYISADFTNKLYESADSISLYDVLPDSYYFLPLDRINRIRSRSVKIIKGTEYQNTKCIPNNDVLAYFMKLNIKTTSENNIIHIQEMLKRKIVCLDDEMKDLEEIKKYKKGITFKNVEVVSKKFKYKYKKGVSKFSKRYLTLQEFHKL